MQIRHTIVFLTLIVIIATLLFQAITLLPLIQRLKVGDPGREEREERTARIRTRRTGIAAAKRSKRPEGASGGGPADLIARLESGSIGIARSGALGRHAEHRPALLQALDAQPRVVDRLRDAGRMGSALAERLDAELDLDAMNAVGDGARLTDAGEE